MRLYELVIPPGFGPTKRFYKFHGRYCGPGNKGLDPDDPVDAACQEHDVCYFVDGRYNPACDRIFIKHLEGLLNGTELTKHQRMKAAAMRAFFRLKIRNAGYGSLNTPGNNL